ncbi:MULTISPECIES: BMC domain-containing protein [unclassified Luteococcus]|uniref:BMC domain-containing protein n=1 Tax=unclassified Luteococcus TaxID=2639923 RepID=UPI00313C414E
MEVAERQRIIQEFVPGKQVTLAHVIANPDAQIFTKLGIRETTSGAIGICTITPSEAAIIAADVATKAAAVQVAFIDRFSGSLVIHGSLADCEAAVREIVGVLTDTLAFTPAPVTRS